MALLRAPPGPLGAADDPDYELFRQTMLPNTSASPRQCATGVREELL